MDTSKTNAKDAVEEPSAYDHGSSGPAVVVHATPAPAPANNRKKWLICAAISVVTLLVVVVVSVAVSNTGYDYYDDDYVSTAVDFTTGVSLITSYSINATIEQRLARTVITMEVANALDCTSIHGVTLQLPVSARVAALRTVANDGCTSTGEVKEIGDARETFAESASSGLPTAYVEARDSTTYSVQVSLPAMGNTVVEVVVEELLSQKLGRIEFQVPLVPSEKVDQVSLAIEILGVGANDTEAGDAGPSFELDLGPDLQLGSVTSPFSLSLPDAREYDLPQILSGEFEPSSLPDQGVLLLDGDCFEHVFVPSSLQPKAKNIYFLLDSSSSWPTKDSFFADMKVALKSYIDTLTPQDTLTIQVVARRGTEALWGSTRATEEEKIEAKQFVDEIQQSDVGANLHEALLEGLLRAKLDANVEDAGTVTLLTLLSNNGAYVGATNRTKIVSDVWKLNEGKKVKVFSLAGPAADTQLLNAIAVTNSGKTASVAEGTVDLTSQMQSFLGSEVGSVLLSDVGVEFTGGSGVLGVTRSSFPLLAQGSELTVRGLLPATTSAGELLQAVTTAKSSGGEEIWTAAAQVDPFVASIGLPNSRCFQSYAHSRVTELMNFHDVAIIMGDAVVEPIVTLVRPCDKEESSFADCIKEEALDLALKANIVIPALTALTTVDNDKCLPYEEDAEICLDGTQGSSIWDDIADEGYPQAARYSASQPAGFFLTSLICLLAGSFISWW